MPAGMLPWPCSLVDGRLRHGGEAANRLVLRSSSITGMAPFPNLFAQELNVALSDPSLFFDCDPKCLNGRLKLEQICGRHFGEPVGQHLMHVGHGPFEIIRQKFVSQLGIPGIHCHVLVCPLSEAGHAGTKSGPLTTAAL